MRVLAAAACVAFVLLAAGAAADTTPVPLVLSWSGTGWTQTLSLDSLTLRPFLPEGAYSVSYTADGTRMTYIEGTSVMVAYGDGSAPWYVPTSPLHSAAQPSLSPDGTHVVFVGDGGHLYVATVGSVSGEVHQITSSSQDSMPAWSPRGDVIAFTRRSDVGRPELWLVGPTGGERELTFGGVNTYSSAPAWSRDGTKIAFAEETSLGNHISLMNADGTDAHPITPDLPRPFGATAPAWSPDGTRIAFTQGPNRLDVIGVDGQNWAGLHDGGSDDIISVAWRPSGSGVTTTLDGPGLVVSRRSVVITGHVRSIGDQAATGVAVSVAASARVVSVAIGSTSIPGDSTTPVRVTLAPLHTGPLEVTVTATAANDANHTDDAATVDTTVSACTVRGTDGNDHLRAHGDYVCALEGNDVVNARNGKPDRIDGGPGDDTAIVDRFDRTMHVEHIRR